MPVQRGSAVKAENGALILDYSGTQKVVGGLNSLTLPSYTRNTITISQFGVEFDFQETTSAAIGNIGFGGNLLIGDDGQDALKAAWLANTKITDFRLYLDQDQDHFLTVDTANDNEAHVSMVGYNPQAADKNGIFSFSAEFTVGGYVATFVAHKTGTGIALVSDAGSGATITDTDSEFVTKGFKAGDTLIIEGSTADDGQYIIESVAAGTLTLTSDFDLTGETAGESITLHGGRV